MQTRSLKVSKNTALLQLYTVFYLLPSIFSSRPEIQIWSAWIFLSTTITGFIVNHYDSPEQKNATALQSTWVVRTSKLEGVATLTGLILGSLLQAWWIFGTLITGAATLHFISLSLAYKRHLDFLATIIGGFAFLLTLIHIPPSLWDDWAFAGGLLAGITLNYSYVLWSSKNNHTSTRG